MRGVNLERHLKKMTKKSEKIFKTHMKKKRIYDDIKRVMKKERATSLFTLVIVVVVIGGTQLR
jgi:hypothetical protein